MGAVIVTGVSKTHPIQRDIIHDVEKKKNKKIGNKTRRKAMLELSRK